MRKGELMRSAGIGSRNTFDSIIDSLGSTGLVKVSVVSGEHAGNEFEVFTPEEIGYAGEVTLPISLPSQTSQPTQPGQPSAEQNMRRADSAETGQSAQSSGPVNNELVDNSKTLFKDFLNHDDEKQVTEAMKRLREAAIETTGRDPDWRGFSHLIDLFIHETGLAASRTESVTSYFRFGVENLNRKCQAPAKRSSARSRPFDPGRSKSGSDVATEIDDLPSVAEPLTEEGKKAALEKLRPMFANRGLDAIEWCELLYTPDDWKSLVDTLGGE